ncbi:MAG: hypothetical protein ACPG05_03240, partial [Bdellovibrionales bacterium]
MRKYLLIGSCLVLSGCFSTGFDFSDPNKPSHWAEKNVQMIKAVKAEELQGWWKRFDDPDLNALVNHALE